MKPSRSIVFSVAFTLVAGLVSAAEVPESKAANQTPPTGVTTTTTEIELLKKQLADQQQQIDSLRALLNQQQTVLLRLSPLPSGTFQAAQAEVASIGGMVPAALANRKPFETAISTLFPMVVASPEQAPADAVELGKKVEETAKALDGAIKNLAGFKFSGDFRYRFDVQARTGNNVAGPLQNFRSRYRIRLNVDKELSKYFDFHVQLSTGPYTNETTNDQDWSGFAAKNPFSVAEAWMRFKPNKYFQFRVGRMEEVFSDNQRYMWDDDVRMPGFEQIIRLPTTQSKLFKNIEFRAAQYVLENPNVPIVPANSPFIDAGFPQGTKVRAANLYDGGVLLKGSFTESLSHTLVFNAAIFRNPNLIQLASTAGGFPVEVSNALGIALSGPIGQTGNATTTPGGPRLFASDYQITHLGYKLDTSSLFTARGHKVPASLDMQFSRNLGAPFASDAAMGILSVGSIKKHGDMRFLYSYSVKSANSLIAQFTDDDLGTATGVNTRVHAFRYDLGLTKFLQWQNLFFFQDEISKSNPSINFFVPVQRGANTTFRYLGHLAFTF